MSAKTIGILTSGGDCPGLNAVIRAVVHSAHRQGWKVFGIRDGTRGLIDRPVRADPLHPEEFNGTVMRLGGTILGTTNKGNPFKYPTKDGRVIDLSDQVIEGARDLGLDALIGIGGDGSLAILNRLAEQGGIPLVGIPKTIDNDIGCTEMSVGFPTVVDVATEALDRLQPTAASHARVMVLEVMGRDAGHIALHAGIAGGADVVLIPEVPYRLQRVADHIKAIRATGRNFVLVLVSEAVKTETGQTIDHTYTGGETRLGGIGHHIGARIAELTGAETRVTVLGHVQRGAQPNALDRITASAFGVHAVELIAAGQTGRMVAWSQRGVTDVPIAEAIAGYHSVDVDGAFMRTARALGVCFGD